MTLPDKQSIYVTLHNISEGGCCVIRTGQLPLKPADQVRIEVWHDDIQLAAPRQARCSKRRRSRSLSSSPARVSRA